MKVILPLMNYYSLKFKVVKMSYIKIDDYDIPSVFEFSLIPFTNKGLDKEIIKQEIKKIHEVNVVSVGGFNGNCEFTLYHSCFNKVTIKKVVEEIEEKLNNLLGNKKHFYSNYSNLSEQDYDILFGKCY